MHKWIPVATTKDIKPDGYKVVTLENTSILIINSKGNYFALENMCTHDGGRLTDSLLDNDEIICPRHGAAFCIKTGKVTRPPAYEAIRCFELRVRKDTIEIHM